MKSSLLFALLFTFELCPGQAIVFHVAKPSPQFCLTGILQDLNSCAVLMFKVFVFCSRDCLYHGGEVYLSLNHFSGVLLGLINVCRTLLRFSREAAIEVQRIIINLKLIFE